MDALKNAVNLHGGAYDPAGVHINLQVYSVPGDAWNGRLTFCCLCLAHKSPCVPS